MDTKYVRSHSGLFAIFNAGIGLQHVDVAAHIEDARSMSDAGFVALEDGAFRVYGRSLTLGIGHDRSAEKAMNEALAARTMRIYELGQGAVVTNAELPGEYRVVDGIDDLITRRVILRD